MKEIIVGTRGSKLALKQTNMIIDRLKKIESGISYNLKTIKTTGDRILHKSLDKVGGKGLFIKEIEASLLRREIDMAVHSLKDMPAKLNKSFVLACYPRREDASDALISRQDLTLDELPRGSVLGTGSLRRQVQLKKYRSDLRFVNIRGNVDTRIKKMEEQKLDGIILAAAGLHRLGLKHLITQYISHSISIPAVGQGILGIEILRDNQNLEKLLKKMDRTPARIAAAAERGFLSTLDGNCHLPIGAYARVKESAGNNSGYLLEVSAFLADTAGDKYIEKDISVQIRPEQAGYYGNKLAEEILRAGGDLILKDLKAE